MIKLNVDCNKFAQKYGLTIEKDRCRNCGCEVVVDQPLITKDFVGFESIAHECGDSFKIAIIKPLDPSFWDTAENPEDE